MSLEPESAVPDDFPRYGEIGWAPGFAEKYVAQQSDGKFRSGLTDAQLYERYLGCHNLLVDLINYCRRKKLELPSLSDVELRNRVNRGIENSPDLGASQKEIAWVLSRLSQFMGWDC